MFSSVIWLPPPLGTLQQPDLLIQCGKLVPVNTSSKFNSQSHVHLWDVSWLMSLVSYKLGVGCSGFTPFLGLCECRGVLSIYVCNGWSEIMGNMLFCWPGCCLLLWMVEGPEVKMETGSVWFVLRQTTETISIWTLCSYWLKPSVCASSVWEWISAAFLSSVSNWNSIANRSDSYRAAYFNRMTFSSSRNGSLPVVDWLLVLHVFCVHENVKTAELCQASRYKMLIKCWFLYVQLSLRFPQD